MSFAPYRQLVDPARFSIYLFESPPYFQRYKGGWPSFKHRLPPKAKELSMSLLTSPSPFTFGEQVGLVLLAEASATSACAIIGLLFYISVCNPPHQHPIA
jgi:hypothetical protein